MLGSYVRASLELAPLSRCRQVAEKDGKALSSDPKAYVKSNLASYYILMNTWLAYIRMYSQYGWIRVGEMCSHRGLVDVINESVGASQDLIDGVEVRSPLFRQIIADVMRPHVTWGMPNISASNANLDPMASALQILRYPKRFSPLGADRVQSASIKTFLDVENHSRWLQSCARAPFSCSPTNFPLLYARDAMSRLLDWDAVCDQIEADLKDARICEFTGGAAQDAKPYLASKLRATLKSNPEYFGKVQGVPLVGSMPRAPKIWYTETDPNKRYRYEEVRKVKVAAVPKSYKAARIIAMEDSYRQARAHRVFTILEKHLPRGINLHDQSQNQRLARVGSLDGSVATIDLTSASDCITKSLFWAIYPSRFTQLVYPLLGTHCSVNGKLRVMQTMATSGNSLTFVLESLVFYAIDVAAHEFMTQLGGGVDARNVRDGDDDLPVPSVYGDDQIIWSADYDVTVHFLQALGFMVNEAKSYTGDSPFRESCGSDWYLGVDVSSVYFPRRPLRGVATEKSVRFDPSDYKRDGFTGGFSTSLTSLIALQHRLYDVCPDAALFLRDVAKESKGSLTTSEPGSPWGDLWDYVEQNRLVYAPGVRKNRSELLVSSPRDLARAEQWQYVRKLRMLPTVEYSCPDDEDATVLRRLYDVYKYQEFLRNGPRYADALMRTLGVSERPLTFEEVCGSPTVRWRWIEATDA